MMRQLVCAAVVLSIVSALFAASPARAQNWTELVFGLYPVPAAQNCGSFDESAFTDCPGSPAPVSGPVDVWVFAFHWSWGMPGPYSSIESLLFHIGHEDLPLVAENWVLCTGGSQVPGPGWPATSGSSLEVTWPQPCHTPNGRVAKIGFFHLENPSGFLATGSGWGYRWIDCNGLDHHACGGVGGRVWFTPFPHVTIMCLCASPGEEVTWSRVKMHYQ